MTSKKTLLWKEIPEELPCSLFWLSAVQASVLMEYEQLKMYVPHLPCWVPQEVISLAVYGSVAKLRTVEEYRRERGLEAHWVWATEFSNAHATFSGFKEAPLVMDGIIYNGGVETYYQLMKSEGLPSHTEALAAVERLGVNIDPLEAWSIGQQYGIRSDWSKDRSVEVMRNAVEQKFTQNAALRELLLSTRNHPLVQLKCDPLWGTGSVGEGRNELGVILESLRASERQKELRRTQNC